MTSRPYNSKVPLYSADHPRGELHCSSGVKQVTTSTQCSQTVSLAGSTHADTKGIDDTADNDLPSLTTSTAVSEMLHAIHASQD